MAPGGGFRDHWRQNVCVLPAPIPVKMGDIITVVACHDDWRVWFGVSPPGVAGRGLGEGPEPPRGSRLLFGGSRLRAYADPSYSVTPSLPPSLSLRAARGGTPPR